MENENEILNQNISIIEDLSLENASDLEDSSVESVVSEDLSLENASDLEDSSVESVVLDEPEKIFQEPLSQQPYEILFLLTGILFILVISSLIFVTWNLSKQIKWRKRYTDNKSVIFPDAHIDFLEDLKNDYKVIYEKVKSYGKLIEKFQEENVYSRHEIISGISNFNKIIDEQKNELDRFKQGYDFSTKSKTINALIEIKDLVDAFLKEDVSKETREKLDKINRYLNANLDELDVEPFYFSNETSIRDLPSNEFEINEIINVEDKSLNEKVSKTISSGYVLIHENGRRIIRKTKVDVNRCE